MQKQPQSLACQICSTKVLAKCYTIHKRACEKKLSKSAKKATSNAMSTELIPCSECGQMVDFCVYCQHLQECVGRQLSKCPQCKLLYPTFLFQQHISLCTTFKEQQPVSAFKKQAKQQEIALEFQEEEDFEMNELIMGLAQNMQSEDEPLTLEMINLMKKRNNERAEDCSICYCTVSPKAQIIRLACRHVYHVRCLTAWLQKNPHCPLCRRHVLH